jgi:hypothetical protein
MPFSSKTLCCWTWWCSNPASLPGIVLAAKLSGKLKRIAQGGALILVTGLHAALEKGIAVPAGLSAWYLTFQPGT